MYNKWDRKLLTFCLFYCTIYNGFTVCKEALTRFIARYKKFSLHFWESKQRRKRGNNNTNTSNRGKLAERYIKGVDERKPPCMPCGSCDGFKGVGRSETQNGTATKRSVHGTGTKDGKTEKSSASAEASRGLFESIGEYFRISEQAERKKTQNEASCVERYEQGEKSFQASGNDCPAFLKENIRTYITKDGLHTVTDTEGSKSHRYYRNGVIYLR